MKYKSFKIIVLAVFVLFVSFQIEKVLAVGSVWVPAFTLSTNLSVDQNTLTYSTNGTRSGAFRENCGEFTPFYWDAGYNWGGYIGGPYVATPYLMDSGTASVLTTAVTGNIALSDITQTSAGREGDANCDDPRRYSFYDSDPPIDNGTPGTFTTVSKSLNISSLPNGTYTLSVSMCASGPNTDCGTATKSFTVTARASSYTVNTAIVGSGSITPSSQSVTSGNTTSFTKTSGTISTVTSSDELKAPLGGWSGNVYTTGPITGAGTYTFAFASSSAPTVTTTSPVTNINQTAPTASATGGGNTVSNGGDTVSVAGLVWSLTANPTTSSNSGMTTDGWALGGPWTSNMVGLTPNATYYVRAYATNSVFTSYGADVTFTTPLDFVAESSPTLMSGVPYVGKPTLFNAQIGGWYPAVSGVPSFWRIAWTPNMSEAPLPVPGNSWVITQYPSNPTTSTFTAAGSGANYIYSSPINFTTSEGKYLVMGCVNGTSPANVYSNANGPDYTTYSGPLNGSTSGELYKLNNCTFWTSLNVNPGCTNGATDPPTCTTCGNPLLSFWDTATSSCIAPVGMTGTLTPATPTCTFPPNASGCSKTLTWTTQNPVGVSHVTNGDGATPNPGPDANNSSATFTIGYNGGLDTTFYLYNNAQQLAFATLTPICAGPWDTAANPVTCLPAASSLPDLTASAPTPAIAAVNVATTFSSTISNIGTGSTGASFSNFFQVATAPGGKGILTDIASASTPALAAGATRAITKSYTFPITGTFSIRTCADKTNRNSLGVIDEGVNEGNNCSSWTDVTVAAAASDLTASAPAPVMATPNVAQTYTSTISNIGTATTGAGFTNLFQISSFSSGSNPTNYTTTTASAVAAGGTTTTSKSLTLAAGTYYMRVCADNDASFTGTISESNETNNCSTGAPTPWTAITVGVACSVQQGNPCNPANACGMTNSIPGTLGCDGVTCSVSAPSDTLCDTGNGTGACGVAHYACVPSSTSSTNRTSSTSKWTWKCGTTACTELKKKPIFIEN
ncbi:MAG: CARDB domain-containing protein [Candidatus Paceibacterota bacterium]|jgi:hypothetical protein